MNQAVNNLIFQLEEKKLTPEINLDRPLFIQPEDRISYRSARIVVILGTLNKKHGLSKEVIACIDFLLRNTGYQKKFIVEYFKSEIGSLQKRLSKYNPSEIIEIDFNIVQYKSVPWDLRFNDMFLYLYVRHTIQFLGEKPNLRVKLSQKGEDLFSNLKDVFIDEINFLELFGKQFVEDRAKKIITEVIPNSYWRDNEKLDYQ